MFKEFFEDTVSADIAQSTQPSKVLRKQKDCKEDCKEDCEKMDESPVGAPGRTSEKDAEEHLAANPDLLKRFKKIVKELGGITATRKLLMQLSSKGL